MHSKHAFSAQNLYLLLKLIPCLWKLHFKHFLRTYNLKASFALAVVRAVCICTGRSDNIGANVR